MKNLLVLSSLFCLIWLVACGGGPSGSDGPESAPAPPAAPTAPAAPLSACSLLTIEEAAAIIGEPIEEPNESNSGSTVSNCNWSARSLSGRGLGILIRRAYSDAEAARVYTEARDQSKSLSNVDPQTVSGLGDNAYWAGGNLNQLNVFKGRYWLIIMAMAGQEDALRIAQQVAEKALERLPE
jgi:hypothetical protein